MKLVARNIFVFIIFVARLIGRCMGFFEGHYWKLKRGVAHGK